LFRRDGPRRETQILKTKRKKRNAGTGLGQLSNKARNMDRCGTNARQGSWAPNTTPQTQTTPKKKNKPPKKKTKKKKKRKKTQNNPKTPNHKTDNTPKPKEPYKPPPKYPPHTGI